MARPPLGIRLIFLAATVLGIATALVWAWTLRVDPSRLDQEYLHEVATTSAKVRMHPLPTRHHVSIEPVNAEDLGPMLSGYLPPPLGTGPLQVEGYYDPTTRTIHVTGRLARLSASSPVRQLRGLFVHALRHEYGHAFLDDWLRSRPGENVYLEQLSLAPEAQTTSGLPEPLVPVVEEFTHLPSDVYGGAYAMSNFNEFFAESYARYLNGKWVPPEMARFLGDYAETR